ncbi:hypothetical protein GCM10018785_59350 [Streptomyces longispororuber]|uniref:DUF6879 domain-containing protein n=1 Tax=Streptomyces longispororuber TaxID=68230 RepID=A0A919DVM4_9ACTN|nr:DUF6879 family protein [Streptomyces longispororuber]GHE83521.1 hypothetical protein GCM10018785_59350 [Streptomyces longispororuber]
MAEFIDDSTFGSYFEAFEHTAWRLETRRGYGSDRASDKYRHYLENGEVPDDLERPWCLNVRAQTRQGKRIERVRIVDEPPTREQMYLLAGAAANNAAGEDIRNLWRADAERIGLPSLDFWLFDSARALVLHFDDADGYLGAELVVDPARIVEYCQVRDAAWHHANRREEFLRQIASGA